MTYLDQRRAGRLGFLALACVLCACGETVQAPDAGFDAAAPPPPDASLVCASDEACDDGSFCNGVERCLPDDATADAMGCVAASAPACASPRTCREAARACITDCDVGGDADGDGVDAPECGGADCDDGDADVYPGAVEVCDAEGRDEDCDPSTLGALDGDSDGFLDASCCNGMRCGLDCDDAMASRRPGAIERCDGMDDDCDGRVDEHAMRPRYADADGDGFGSGEMMLACGAPGLVLRAGDCADDDDTRHPGVRETCDGVDDDCDGMTDEGASSSCPPSFACIDAACVPPGACGVGLFECDGDLGTACETDVSSDEMNCGECGRVCAARHACLEGICTLRATGVSTSVGYAHSCAVTTAGSVACWGQNSRRDLADGTIFMRTRPFESTVPAPIDTVAVGDGFACARSAGSIYCWGSDVGGELGDGMPNSASFPPQLVPSVSGASDLCVGRFHSCVVSAGRVLCWGTPGFGALGDGTFGSSATPVEAIGITDAVSVACAEFHTCAVRSTGAVACWGNGIDGELGDGLAEMSMVPVTVSGLTDAVDVVVGLAHSCAVRSTGTLVCWGSDFDGQMGLGLTFGTSASTPVPVPGITGATQIAAGEHHTCAVHSGGLSCWGRDDAGQVGDGPGTPMRGGLPVRAAPFLIWPSGVRHVALGQLNTCAVRDDGTYCWGFGELGLVGDGFFDARQTPVRIEELSL